MAHDWSGLLFEIEALSARRAASLIDDEEELRRRRATGVALSAREPGQRFVATGIAKKGAAGASIPLSEPTIASILQAPASSQQGVIALVGVLDGGGNRGPACRLCRGSVHRRLSRGGRPKGARRDRGRTTAPSPAGRRPRLVLVFAIAATLQHTDERNDALLR